MRSMNTSLLLLLDYLLPFLRMQGPELDTGIETLTTNSSSHIHLKAADHVSYLPLMSVD